ncbi:WS/DGAT domain-containing protein [Cryptosporangium japonicum]|uniref:O-acyltransferase WSD1 C-terminal domain-containing protein n=1 Tax=Cryptosporangium japonicum TaxID=80872 RepID=A0ABN0TJ68_9ACTN
MHVVESDLTGPAAPISVFGAKVRTVIPIGSLAGNVPISVLALSYAGELVVAIQTDADAVPDAEILVEGVRAEWKAWHGTNDPRRGAAPATP